MSATSTPSATSTTSVTPANWNPKDIVALDKLGTGVQQAQSTIPTTRDTNLPTAYIDATILATLSAADDPLEAAIPISYLEGFPTVNGVPIWERLENEPIPEYELFKLYREMPNHPNSNGTRAIQRVAQQTGVSVNALHALAKLRHWRMRCAAYDKFVEMEHENYRQRAIRKMENMHAQAAERLFEQALEFFKQYPEELTGKVAVEALKLAVQLHRISLGLPPDKPASNPNTNNGTGGTTINVNMQQTSATAPQLLSQKEEQSRLLEIVSILQQSGALQPRPQVIDIDSGEGVEDVDSSTNTSADTADTADTVVTPPEEA